jgi:NAD dependent epimerase/dehydratase family enzyme
MKVIAVTGGSAGIGRATAERFARTGARVGLIARGRERLEAAAAEVERLGGEALVLPLDVADHAAVDDAAAQIEERFGPLDVWVNNAIATVFAPVTRITPEEFRSCRASWTGISRERVTTRSRRTSPWTSARATSSVRWRATSARTAASTIGQSREACSLTSTCEAGGS